MGQTFAEKILARKSGLKSVSPGQIVTVKPDLLLSHDNTAAIVGKIQNELETYGVWDSSRHVIILDHVIPAASEKTAKNHLDIRKYVNQHGIKHFYDVGEGICHQVMTAVEADLWDTDSSNARLNLQSNFGHTTRAIVKDDGRPLGVHIDLGGTAQVSRELPNHRVAIPGNGRSPIKSSRNE